MAKSYMKEGLNPGEYERMQRRSCLSPPADSPKPALASSQPGSVPDDSTTAWRQSSALFTAQLNEQHISGGSSSPNKPPPLSLPQGELFSVSRYNPPPPTQLSALSGSVLVFIGSRKPVNLNFSAGYHCDEAPFALNKHIQELISPQQRVMERGLSVFCQAFDGVIDCEGYRGGGAWIQIETQSLV
ncbi:hypothetical protein NQZ68_012904 [Dissostichus eleginoides]|nr:hypothetical protein NQZ68_012904 [Dissostichus eleginoides]